jgi:very-short-patch-repair endonuclease
MHRSISYPQLCAEGYTREEVEESLRRGILVRARRNVYVPGAASDEVRAAARIGGRLDCVSALRELGVFVLDHHDLHVQVEPNRKHLRSPRSRRVRLARSVHRVVVHWRAGEAPEDDLLAPPIIALAQAIRCQRPRAAVATLDSALHQGIVADADLDAVFGRVPSRLHPLRQLIDGQAEAGPETFARLLVRAFGRRVELQQWIGGVGRVDLLVDGWLVIECDSREHHGGWEAQERDRLRDLALAARGYVCIRPTARQIFQQPHLLVQAVHGLLAARTPSRAGG